MIQDAKDYKVEHYDTKIPPIEYINANEMPFAEGNVVKYISRYQHKGELDDLCKCLHYVLLTMQRVYLLPDDMISRIMSMVNTWKNSEV